jgi:geranyl-CoA carboxylase alpha subunit
MAELRTILIANRGEIACRIMRSARAMGYRTAAVYSEADADALHVRHADVAACIGPAEAGASYLNAGAIIAAARRLDADAIHPGYGFLSENTDFARACHAAGLIFIGPSPEAIAAMGNKAAAKRLMLHAGVPCLPGYQGRDQSDAAFAREAERLGFPVMVKAAAGGGGRGMRHASTRKELPAVLAAARAEAAGAFGSGELILERAMPGARHIEIQILADHHGACIHLGERDCSVQRRHQKVLEEAPAPAVDRELRSRMVAAALAAARAIGYTNAGTVELLVGDDGAFYFLEMNTRLQVEHPVTEMITGIDLVALQIRIAAGEPLGLLQEDVRFSGHAIEARLYAEAPHANFLPQSGKLAAWRAPSAAGIRVDHGLVCGQVVSPCYDPLLAKVVAHGATREEARRRLIGALGATVALGIATNRAFLIDCLAHPQFARGEATTEFIARHFESVAAPTLDTTAFNIAAALWFEQSARAHGHEPARAWASSGAIAWPLVLDAGTGPTPSTVSVLAPGRYAVTAGEATRTIEIFSTAEDRRQVRCRGDGKECRTHAVFAGDTLHLALAAGDLAVRETLYARRVAEPSRAAQTELRAPINGKVVCVLVSEGQPVAKGQPLVIVEAMKMQHEMTAPCNGTIARIAVTSGDQVANRQLLVELNAQ